MEEMAKMIAIAKRFGGTGGGTSTVVVLEETTLTGEGELALGTPFAVQPEAGKTYKVTYNGTPYDCPGVAHDLGGGIMGVLLGNAAMAEGSGGNEDAPFVLVVVPPAFVDQMGAYAAIYDASGATSVTLSIMGPPGETSTVGMNYIVHANVTSDRGNFTGTADKSIAQVVEALEKGMNVVCYMKSETLPAGYVFRPFGYNEETVKFSALAYENETVGVLRLQYDGTYSVTGKMTYVS
jgi:hypothetical protein